MGKDAPTVGETVGHDDDTHGRQATTSDRTVTGDPPGSMLADAPIDGGDEGTHPGPVITGNTTVAPVDLEGLTIGGAFVSDHSSPGPAVPGYQVLGELGRGGMGVVYLARQVRLQRPCALKMILAAHHAGTTASARFLAEAATVAKLQHPNIVQIHAIGDHDGRPYFELELVEGGSLSHKLDGTPWVPLRAAALVETLARATGAAHRLGIVHRDLKPGNVLLAADGTPKLADFGLAKSIDSDSSLTQSGAIMGTPSYMAPEQAEGNAKGVGPAADVYALGAILYELLTGRPPFRGATVMETLQQVKSTEPVPPSRLVPGLPRDIETVVLKCLQKDPAKRYESAAALADDLRRFEAGEPIVARPVGAVERTWRWCRRNPSLAGSLGAAAALVAVAVLAVLYVGGQARSRNEIAAIAKDLKKSLDNSEALLATSNQRLAALHFERGQIAFEKGQIGHGLLWMIETWRSAVAAGDPGWQHTARANLAVWQSHDIGLKALFSHQGLVLAVAFSPDGKAVLTGSVDKTARVLTITELPDDLPRLTTWVELVTGLELDGNGSVRTLDNAAWRQRRDRLDREGGPPETGRRWQLDPIHFGSEPTARARAWIERERWAEAETAFNNVVLARPFDTDVLLERARFHAVRSQLDMANDDFVQAYALGSRDSKLVETIVRNEALFYRAIARVPDSVATLWSQRGGDHARKQQWAEAAADFGQAVRLRPEVLTHRQGQILSHGAAGEFARLWQARSDLVDRVSPTIDPFTANNAAWFAALAPGVDAHLEALVRLAEIAVNGTPDAESKATYLNTLGAALFRAGRFEDAIRRLEEGIQLRNGTSVPQDWVFLAMAHHRLGHRDQARRYLERLRSRQPNAAPNQFWDEVEIRLLQNEAEATILYDPIFPADPFRR